MDRLRLEQSPLGHLRGPFRDELVLIHNNAMAPDVLNPQPRRRRPQLESDRSPLHHKLSFRHSQRTRRRQPPRQQKLVGFERTTAHDVHRSNRPRIVPCDLLRRR